MMLTQMREQQRAGARTCFNRITDLSFAGCSRNGLKCQGREGACAMETRAYLNDTAPDLVKKNVHGYFRIIALVRRAVVILALFFFVGVSSSMSSHSVVFAICCLGFTLPAAAQLNSSALRSKYGPPLNRETFHMPEGFDLVVDYDAANQACKMEVPALMPTNATVSNSEEMKKRMYDFLADLVPAAMRGKELARSAFMSGMTSISSVEYEYVTIH